MVRDTCGATCGGAWIMPDGEPVGVVPGARAPLRCLALPRSPVGMGAKLSGCPKTKRTLSNPVDLR